MRVAGASLVLFGLDGAYATVPLRALSNAGLRPRLVVVGRERSRGALRPLVRLRRHRPGMLERLQRRLRTEDDALAEGLDLVQTAHALGIDVLETDLANDPGAQATIASADPDLFVVAGFPHLLSRSTLGLARLGGLNVHPGKLPEERGAAPLFWALKEGQPAITVTIHVLDEGEDSGDIVSTCEVPVPTGTEGGALLAHCANAAAPGLLRAVRGMLGGDLVRFPQPDDGAGRRPRPSFRDGCLDASRPAAAVYTFVSACADRYSLFAECGGDRFFIRRAVSFDAEARCDFEFVLTGDRLLLRCEPGLVELELKEDGALFSAEYVPAPNEPRLGLPGGREA